MVTPTPPSLTPTNPTPVPTSPLDRRPHISWFRVLGPLGGSGVEGRRVWHPFHQRPCALRRVPCASPEDQRLLYKASRRLRRLAHPRLVSVLDVLFLENEVGLLEDDDGEGYTLRQSLDEMGALQLDEALSIFRQVLDGIAGLHQAGLVHGDLHPGHIRLDVEDGTLQVRIRGIGPPLLGSPPTDDRYLAPERISGASPDRRADVFALGVIFYECVSGRQPFEEPDPWERRKRIRAGELVPLQRLVPQLPMELVFAVDSALRGEPAQRFADARAFARAVPAQVALDPRGAPAIPSSFAAVGDEDEENIGIEPEITEVIDVPEPQTAEYVSGVQPAPEGTPPSAAALAAAVETPEVLAATTADGATLDDEDEIKKHARPEPPSPEEPRGGAKLGASSVDLVLGLSKVARLMAIPGLLLFLFIAFMSASGFQDAQDQERELGQIEDALEQMMQELAPLAEEAIALGVEPNAVHPMLAEYKSARSRSERQSTAETMAAGLLRLVRSLPETEDLALRDRRRTLERRVNHILSEIRNYRMGQDALDSSSEEYFGAWLARFFR